MELLFSYGTLQEERVQLRLFGKKLQGHPDTLIGYRLEEIQLGYRSYPIISPAEAEDKVKGVLFEVTEEDLANSDRYEGSAYQRIKVGFKSGRRAWVYIANR